MCAAAEKPVLWKKFVNSLDDSLDVARTPRGLLRGRQPVCFVICGVAFGGNCQVACEPLCQTWCGHSVALCETFPALCPGTARKLPVSCPDNSPDAARMLRGHELAAVTVAD